MAHANSDWIVAVCRSFCFKVMFKIIKEAQIRMKDFDFSLKALFVRVFPKRLYWHNCVNNGTVLGIYIKFS